MSDSLTYLPMLLDGLKVTVGIFICAVLLAVVFAIVTGVVRYEGPAWLRWPVTCVLEFFRGTSCLVQLFWAFYVLPLFGLTLTPFVTSVLVLGLNVGSFGSELVRGSLEAVPRGQVEAAKALNYSAWNRFRHIQLPQALAIAIKPSANLMVDLLKLTPLTSLVTVNELTRNAMIMRTQTGSTAEMLLMLFVFYFLLASVIYAVMNRLEIKVFGRRDRPGRGAPV